MKRSKILSTPISLKAADLENFNEDAFDDDVQHRRQQSDLRRWRKLKHQLA